MMIMLIAIFVFGSRKRRKMVKDKSKDAQDVEEEIEQERVITLRPLNMQDFKVAKSQVRLLYNRKSSVIQ